MAAMIFGRHGAEDHTGMDMTGGTAAAATTTTAAAADAHGHDADSSSGSMMMMMMSVFQTDMQTPLYSTKWTPTTAGGYAGTILFLVFLAMIFRSLLAVKAWQEGRWLDAELNRRFVAVNGRLPLAEKVSNNSLAKRMTLTENGVEEDVMVVRKRSAAPRPWRFSVDPLRAVLDTVIVGVGYLLMLAVMTMNVGYFLAVLGGTFLGSLAIGRYAINSEH